MKSLSIYFVDEETGLLRSGLRDKKPRRISNESVLLEKIIKILLTKLNSNLFSPEVGSEFATIPGNTQNITLDHVTTVVQLGISDVESSVITEQQDQLLPDSQKLLELNLINVEQNPSDPTTFHVTLEVINEENKEYRFTIPL